jgi:hypothetical protein
LEGRRGRRRRWFGYVVGGEGGRSWGDGFCGIIIRGMILKLSQIWNYWYV